MSKICFCVPYFNHPNTINSLCDELKKYNLEILIIDDASDEISKKALQNLNATILTHEKNQGKGGAVRSGYLWALKQGFTQIFQLDADMQHDLTQIPKMLELCEKFPKNLICGYGQYDKNAPKARIYGRKITNFWLFINTLGGHFKDAMTGFRIYPLNEKIINQTRTNRMEFDIEILMNYYKFDVEISWLPVAVKYGQISHFRALKDNFLISKFHAKAFFSLPFFIFQRRKNVK